MSEQPPTFDAAMKAFKKLYKSRTTEEIGLDLGVDEALNHSSKKEQKPSS